MGFFSLELSPLVKKKKKKKKKKRENKTKNLHVPSTFSKPIRTLKELSKILADDIIDVFFFFFFFLVLFMFIYLFIIIIFFFLLNFFFSFDFTEKISLDIARFSIHVKCQSLIFFEK